MCHKTVTVILLLGLWTGFAWAGAKLEVRIDGIEDEALDNVKAYLKIEAKKKDPKLTAQWIRRMHKYAPQEIKNALQPFGYFSATVESSLTKESSRWLAHYSVVPGPKTHATKVDLKVTGPGAEEPQIQEALKAFPVEKGDVLDTDAYDTGKDDLLDLVNSLGYAKAKSPLHQIRVNPERNEASIHLSIETGPKYHLGELTFHQEVVNPDLLDRYVQVKPDDVYSQKALLNLQGDLIRTQYFSVVDVNPDFERADGLQIPVDVEMEPADRHKLDLGLGFFTDIGPTGSVQWQFRPINRRGHFLTSQLKLSPVKSSALLSYGIPVRDPRTDKLVLSVHFEHEDTTSQLRDTLNLKGGYYFQWQEWLSSLFAELKHETFTTGTQPETTSLIGSLGGNLERTRVDGTSRFPTRGNYWFLELMGSGGLISDTAYVRSHIKTKHFIPLGERARLNLRAQLGLAWVDRFEKYPSSLRYYAGGDQSVRGYKYQALGPVDPNGEVVGGKHVFTGTVEYDHRVAEDWVAAAFVDGGNAFNESLDKMFYSAGVGARWLSPMGPIRLDFAVPINPAEDNDTNWRIHFGFGADL